MGNETLPRFITEEEMVRQAIGKAPSSDYYYANYERIVKEAEDEFPPDFPISPPKRGRPKAGSVAVTGTAKTIRMESAFWDQLQLIASREDLSLHATIRAALIEYAEKRQAITH